MTRSPPSVRRLGQRLLALEADGRAEPEAVADAVERAARKLGPSLSRLIGAAGYDTLLRRAVHLAGRDFAFLDGVRAPAAADGGLDGLRAAVREVEPERARAALAAVLAELVGLLVTFIGQDLTTGVLGHVWPALELDQASTESEEAVP